MLYVIYNTKTKKYRSNANGDTWTRDLDEAAIFRTEKNANSKINNEQKTWQYYKDTWGKEHEKSADANLQVWKNAITRGVKLELI
jgi:hypothetical protein